MNKSPQLTLCSLLSNQRKGEIPDKNNYGKMSFDDVKRIDKYIGADIFDEDKCIEYKGEIKKNYTTISYNRKKVSVQRLLFHNYVDDIEKRDVIEYLCELKGKCVNINHFKVEGKDKKFEKKQKIPFLELPPPILTHRDET